MQRNIKFCVCVSVTWLFVFDIKDKQECEKSEGLGNQGKSGLIKKIKFNQAVIGERGLGGLRGFARIFLLLSQWFFVLLRIIRIVRIHVILVSPQITQIDTD